MRIKLKEVISDFIVPMRDKPKVFNGKIPWCRIEDIEGKYLYKSLSNQNVSEECIKEMNLKVYPVDTLLFTCSASIGITAITKELVCTNQTFIGLVPSDKIDNEYLYYYLNKIGVSLKKSASITTIPYLPRRFFEELVIEIPKNKNIQRKIAKVLSDLDAKIELNNRINRELEAMAKTLYDYWFVQFDFPNEQGKPYKSSGGKMVYNKELKREIPEGWEVKKLGKCIKIFDSQRIPLSNKERELKKGTIPYYGATGIMDYVDDYIFNDDYILLAEDGSVMNENGFPIIQFIWGKTWVNNHAHVIQANDKEQNEFYYQHLSRIPVVLIKTGSIQMKINQDNLKNHHIIVPPKTLINEYSKTAISIRKSLINNIEQNQQLSKLRDWLLPMLMNGQVTSTSSVTEVQEAEESLSSSAESPLSEVEVSRSIAAEQSVENKKG